MISDFREKSKDTLENISHTKPIRIMQSLLSLWKAGYDMSWFEKQSDQSYSPETLAVQMLAA